MKKLIDNEYMLQKYFYLKFIYSFQLPIAISVYSSPFNIFRHIIYWVYPFFLFHFLAALICNSIPDLASNLRIAKKFNISISFNLISNIFVPETYRSLSLNFLKKNQFLMLFFPLLNYTAHLLTIFVVPNCMFSFNYLKFFSSYV